MSVRRGQHNPRGTRRQPGVPQTVCSGQLERHVERAFSLLGRILTHDRFNMSNETLRHLAIMYVNKTGEKRKYDEEE